MWRVWCRWWQRRDRTSRRALGSKGERLAERFLRRRGYRIVGRGIRNHYGELDLVAVTGRTVVFVEVKTRSEADPEEGLGGVLSLEQQQRMTRAAFVYRRRHRLLQCPCRFDLITVLWPVGGRPEIRHFPHALETTGLDDALY